jgi:hypothetical protein
VALGSCVQAAARASGRPIHEVQDAWALGRGRAIEPGASADAVAEVRRAYATARDLDLD